MYRALVIITILVVSICPLRSNANLVDLFQTLAEHNDTISPSPGPAPVVNITSGQPIVKETCQAASTRCQLKSMTACLRNSKTGPQGSLLVMNDGESSLKVTITILPANNTFMEIEISSHQTEKINISANVGVGSSFVLNAGDGDCTIHTGALAPQFNFYQQFPSYGTYATPINGAYLLIVISIVVGGTFACCKLRKTDRHLDGVPYQELEMGNSTIPVSTNVDVEAAEGWDQDWDDDWDDDKAVKSPGGNRLNGKSTNGTISKSTDSNGWGNDWDD